MHQTWPAAQSFISKQISLSPAQIAQLNNEGLKIGSEERSPTFYFAQIKDDPSAKAKNIGIILFIDGYGDNGSMEISVAMGSDGKVKNVDLWEHSENPLITKDAFLKQFINKTAKDTFVVKKDYQVVPAAPKASMAVANAVEKALRITNIIFEKK